MTHDGPRREIYLSKLPQKVPSSIQSILWVTHLHLPVEQEINNHFYTFEAIELPKWAVHFLFCRFRHRNLYVYGYRYADVKQHLDL